MISGDQTAIANGTEVILNIDGDGSFLVGEADAMGNRFFDLEEISSTPPIRLFGNAVLSLTTKISSGYCYLFDPTNS